MKNIGLNKINVLVTGAANGVGQSIIKSLRISKLKLNIIPADINDKNPLRYRFTKYIIFPKVEDKKSLNLIIKIILKNKIKILFPGSEFEIKFFAKNKNIIENKTNCIIAVCPEKTIKIANNKFNTAKYFDKIKVESPLTYRCSNLRDAIKKSKILKFPIYIKPSEGTSSKNTFYCKNSLELKSLFHLIKNPIIQEFIGKGKRTINNNEYTCSFFVDKNGKKIGPFIAKRNLKFGTSWEIIIIKSIKIKKMMEKICRDLDVRGSINVQFKENGNKIYPIEINSRFSGTTSIRANFGFNEPEMFINSYYYSKDVSDIKIRYGKVYRYIEEVFIEKNLKKNSYINKWF